MPKQTQFLDSNWQVSLADGKPGVELPKAIPASVPGSVHTDLMASGLIENPFLDDNERLYAWIGYCDWLYQTEFNFKPGAEAFTDLVFEGIDTVAKIYLNGHLLAEVVNQHRSYRFAVKDRLVEGLNKLEVRFSSPIRYADRMSLELGYRPHVNHHPYNSIRKTAANFGWDWGIDTSTCGLWKPVYLESYDSRIVSVRPVTSVSGQSGLAEVIIDLDGVTNEGLNVTLGDATATLAETKSGSNTVLLQVENVKKWWPNGDGDANLYSLEVKLGNEDSFSCNVGFKDVELDFPQSVDGAGFEISVNGRKTFIRGVNWIPNDAFLHRITKESLYDRLTQAKRANINLIRVWGGGIYESEEFYEVCNELGLMVWQDFLFACASYSEEGLGAEVEAEATDNITRIMKHPSLVMWNGNNENLWGHQEWNWQLRLDGKSWGEGFYYDLLPRLVRELDPKRVYTPGSPYSPNPDKLHNDPNYGSVHIWDLWNQKDYPHYRDYNPRFVAEFGWQGPANWETIAESISDDPLTPESPGMIIHQKAMSGNDKLTDGLMNHFMLPNNMSDWHWAMQLNQANAIRFGLEHMRSEFPSCMGSIVWQLNDCWPVTSWAAIDGAGREKPLYFSIAQSYSPMLITFSGGEENLSVNILNNQDLAVSGEFVLTLMNYEGDVLQEVTRKVDVSPDSKFSHQIDSQFTENRNSRNTYLLARFGNQKKLHFFADYRYSDLAPADYQLKLEKLDRGYALKITARNLIRDLLLMVDKLDPAAKVDQGLLTVLPGESCTLQIASAKLLRLEDFTGEVVRTANQLVAG
jgi:beta-mannosidase